MTSEFTVTVYGTPQVQGNHRVSRSGYTYDANKKLKPWRDAVALTVRNHMRKNHIEPITDGPVGMALTFVMPRTKAMKDKPAPPMTQRPDTIKLARAIEDALAGVAYGDDSQIIHHYLIKRRAEPDEKPGVKITIKQHAEER